MLAERFELLSEGRKLAVGHNIGSFRALVTTLSRAPWFSGFPLPIFWRASIAYGRQPFERAGDPRDMDGAGHGVGQAPITLSPTIIS